VAAVWAHSHSAPIGQCQYPGGSASFFLRFLLIRCLLLNGCFLDRLLSDHLFLARLLISWLLARHFLVPGFVLVRCPLFRGCFLNRLLFDRPIFTWLVFVPGLVLVGSSLLARRFLDWFFLDGLLLDRDFLDWCPVR
jgi:hypothetical protein